MTERHAIELLVARPTSDDRHEAPFLCGLPCAPGRLTSPSALGVRNADGKEQKAQVDVVERWADDSIRWCHVRANGGAGASLEISTSSEAARSRERESRLARRGRHGALEIDTGLCSFRVGGGATLFPFEAAAPDGRQLLDPASTGMRIIDDQGEHLRLKPHEPSLAVDGPVYAEVHQTADVLRGGAATGIHLTVRSCFAAGSSVVRVEISITNSRAAKHPGGIWTLGDPSSFFLSELSMSLGFTGEAHTVSVSLAEGDGWTEIEQPFAIEQHSSGGDNWQSRAHLDRHAKLPFHTRGWEAVLGERSKTGDRCSPCALLRNEQGLVGAAIEDFWQTFPKRISSTPSTLELALLPKAAEHELQGGERHTTRIGLVFDPRGSSALVPPADVLRRQRILCPSATWCAQALAVTNLVAAGDDPNEAYLELVGESLHGKSNFFEKRETIDEYGWRNFGDLWADHEQVYSSDPAPIVSHYNNQYDAIFAFGTHYLRSNDPRWFELMDDLAKHVADADLYHTRGDKSAYNGGMFWHSAHYVDAGLSSHRSFPRDARVAGGGPSGGHVYASGFLLHYFLTGSARSKEAVRQLGDWVIHADDGTLTPLRWLSRSRTGHISGTADDDFHGPGRSPGNSLSVLIDSHRLTGEQRYLDKARELVRRTIHPQDVIAAEMVEDREQRWSYPIFLDSLGRYLHHLAQSGQAQSGQLDEELSYGRDALLHYARWAARTEIPYLDRVDRLEYPTETWAAQELQKTRMFQWAQRFALDEEERSRFAERGRYFFDTALSTLAVMPTHVFTRPRILLLAKGHDQAAFDLGRTQPIAEHLRAPEQWPPRMRFVPQKHEALSRLRILALLGIAALGGALAATLFLF